ncbi:MAG: M13 family metallopeptidase [Parcubacteria group bacterium]|nr:M13 family metallopeptidase [Parcubacteria group bacterium]
MEQQKTQTPSHNDLVAYLDPAISPTEDFYAHVNQKWCDANPIPAKEGRWGAFMALREETKEKLHALLLGFSGEENLPDGGNKQKLCDFFRVGMDEERLEREGFTPIRHILENIRSVGFPREVVAIAANLHRIGVAPFFAPSVEADMKMSGINRLYFSQAGLSLPERDYYLSDDPEFVRIREAFLAYMERMHCLLGDQHREAAESARAILALETRLAKASLSAVERRYPEKQYHPMTIAEFEILAPAIPWRSYLEYLGVSKEPKYIIVSHPAFIEECNRMIEEAEGSAESLAALKLYLRWHFIDALAGKLSRDFVDLQFGFHEKVLTGAEMQKPRWERVLAAVNGVLGEALGELYVEKHFPSEAKARIHELADDLEEVFKVRLEKRSWMGAETKKRALAKLATFKRKLGYPEKWRDYSRFRVCARDSYAENYMRGRAVESERVLRQIDKDVDRTEWFMPPQVVNAFYNPLWNEVLFPAAILQSPFFDPAVDDAVNYGAIGVVIGHEWTHGFDDQGCKFNEDGNLSEWWTSEDKERFTERAAVLVKQFGERTFFGVPVNGELTLGENIADLGGLALAYEALQRAFARKGRPEAIDGFTPEQRFFLGYARVWRGNIREELARQFLTSDPHSPGHLRVNVPLSNMREFHDAFECKEGCAMHRPESACAEIW